MTLSEIFKTLPPDMVFKSHTNGREQTATEWSVYLSKDLSSGAEVHNESYNYGQNKRAVIYFPGVGPAFTEVK